MILVFTELVEKENVVHCFQYANFVECQNNDKVFKKFENFTSSIKVANQNVAVLVDTGTSKNNLNKSLRH